MYRLLIMENNFEFEMYCKVCTGNDVFLAKIIAIGKENNRISGLLPDIR